MKNDSYYDTQQDTKVYDAIVIVTPADFKRVECNNKRIVDYLPVR